MKTKHKELINHISRLEGQLASVKKEIASNNVDCVRAAATLRAASRSFSSLRTAFITCFLNEKYITKKNDPDLASLLSIINS